MARRGTVPGRGTRHGATHGSRYGPGRLDNGRRHGPWAVAGAFVGTVVGAGFASGQETLRFFTAFGPAGFVGLGVAAASFGLFGVRVLTLGAELRARSHRPLLHHALGPKVGAAFDVLMTVVLLATAAAMASGAASAMAEQFGWPRWAGAVLMMAASGATVLGGVRGVVAAMSAVAPLLVVSILLIGVYSLATVPPGRAGADSAPPAPGAPSAADAEDGSSAMRFTTAGPPPESAGHGTVRGAVSVEDSPAALDGGRNAEAGPEWWRGIRLGLAAALDWPGNARLGAAGRWWSAAALYVAYNMLLAVPVLAPLGAHAAGRGAVVGGGLLGGLGLGVGAAAIHLAVAARMPAAAASDIPMLFAARSLPGWVPLGYSVLLLAEVYTTAVGLLFGLAARAGEEGGRAFRLAAAGGAAAACLGGLVPFARVVGTLYPVIGVLGTLLLVGLARPVRG